MGLAHPQAQVHTLPPGAGSTLRKNHENMSTQIGQRWRTVSLILQA